MKHHWPLIILFSSYALIAQGFIWWAAVIRGTHGPAETFIISLAILPFLVSVGAVIYLNEKRKEKARAKKYERQRAVEAKWFDPDVIAAMKDLDRLFPGAKP